MNGTLTHTSWHGLPALVLENETLRTVVVPELGAKLVSLFDKRSQQEWLVDSADRPFRKVTYGAVFTDQDMSGWDEMFPTIVACQYPAPGRKFGARLPDHGEVWALPWKLEDAPADVLKLSVEGVALPYRLTRSLVYRSADTLQMVYLLENLGEEDLPYIWAAHPQFVCGAGAKIIFPTQISAVCNTLDANWGWGEPETHFSWPNAIRPDGQLFMIDRTGPASLKQARKFFVLPETHAAWAGLVRQPAGDWLQLAWDPEKVPYLGLWIDEGALSHTTVAAPEPTTGFYDSLAIAWEKNEVTVLGPHASQDWTLTVRLGVSGQPFPADAQTA